MINIIQISLFCILPIGLLSCGSSKPALGVYLSRFAEVGMFGTTVRLKPDQTLEYIFHGDMLYDSATGHYRVCGSKLYVLFDPQPRDMFKLYYRYNDMPLKEAICHGDTISYKLLLYLGPNKLFPGHAETGKKVTRAWGYSKRRKYVLFGAHYYVHRCYYRRIG